MTTIHVNIRKPQAGTTDRAPAAGSLDVSLYQRQVEGGHYVVTTRFAQVLVDGQCLLELTPTDGNNAWVINERVRDGKTRVVAVPDSSTTIEYTALVDLNIATLNPAADVALAAWTAAALTATTARDQAVAAAASVPSAASLAATYLAFRATPPSASERAAGVVGYWDTSTVPPVPKGWNGSTWVAVGGSAPAAVATTDNGDGTFTATGSGVTDNGDGTFTITDPTVTANADGTYLLAA